MNDREMAALLMADEKFRAALAADASLPRAALLPQMEDSMTEEAAAQVKCANCGAMNSPTATLCADCGQPMPTGATSLTAPEKAGRPRGDVEVRTASISDWEIRHSGRADEAFTVRGYAAVYDQLSHDLGGFKERVSPGFFDAVLETSPHVVFSWEHDNRYVGASTPNTLALRSDAIGLLVDAQIGNYSWAKDLKLSIERGDNAQGSFAFKVGEEGDDWQVQDDGSVVRTLLPGGASGLYDVTVCAQGAYPQTSMAAVRSLAAVRGRLETGAVLVAPTEGEQESQPGSVADPEITERAQRLLNRLAVARDEVRDLSERAGKLS